MNCKACKGTGNVCPHGSTVMHHVRALILGVVQPAEQCWPARCGDCGGTGKTGDEEPQE